MQSLSLLMKFFSLCLLLGELSFSFLSADQWIKTYSIDAYIGPEIYRINRSKEGGTAQSGVLYGVRFGYDHVRRYKFYWGIDALWAAGVLTGKDADHNFLKSCFTDENVEARLGYTFQSKFWRCASFTPFVGGGYFWENNDYKHPTPLHIHFKNTFSYIPFGFLSQIFVTPSCSIGLNVKLRYILEGEQKVKRDPDFDKLTQHYEEKIQYRIELPTNYFFCWKKHPLGVSVIPFYEFRQYGHRINFPFDFLETKLRLYGVTVKLLYLF